MDCKAATQALSAARSSSELMEVKNSFLPKAVGTWRRAIACGLKRRVGAVLANLVRTEKRSKKPHE
jgi:hypothetical protein